jgi:hypothetical protein
MGEQVKLGSKVQDTVTGIQGTATGRAEYLHGSPSVRIEGRNGDGKPFDEWVPEPRVVLVTDPAAL